MSMIVFPLMGAKFFWNISSVDTDGLQVDMVMIMPHK